MYLIAVPACSCCTSLNVCSPLPTPYDFCKACKHFSPYSCNCFLSIYTIYRQPRHTWKKANEHQSCALVHVSAKCSFGNVGLLRAYCAVTNWLFSVQVCRSTCAFLTSLLIFFSSVCLRASLGQRQRWQCGAMQMLIKLVITMLIIVVIRVLLLPTLPFTLMITLLLTNYLQSYFLVGSPFFREEAPSCPPSLLSTALHFLDSP